MDAGVDPRRHFMKLPFISLLTASVIVGSSAVGRAQDTATPAPPASASTVTSPAASATPAAASALVAATAVAPTALYSLDFDEEADLFYAPGTKIPYEGPVFSNYANGKTELTGALKNGRRDGRWTDYYDSGKLESVGNYRNGNESGDWKYWTEEGTLESEGSYSDGRPVGLWKTFYETGKPESEGIYVDGKKDGPWTTYNEETGRPRTVMFKNGEEVSK
jgi:hypothetical protein